MSRKPWYERIGIVRARSTPKPSKNDPLAAYMMRGDEHKFWKHANQHGPDEPESGL